MGVAGRGGELIGLVAEAAASAHADQPQLGFDGWPAIGGHVLGEADEQSPQPARDLHRALAELARLVER